MDRKIDHTALPDDPEELKALVRTLMERVNILERYIYAKKSEKLTKEDIRQMALFDEAESGSEPEEETDEIEEETVVKVHKREKGRKSIPSDIPREEVYHNLSQEEKTCPCCGKQRPHMGYESSEELVFIPAQMKAVVHMKEKCGPCGCEAFAESEVSPIVTAMAPPRLMPGSIASASLLAFILTGKFCDALPFYRHERIFRRIGIEISRTNMCNWTIKAASKCSELIEFMRDKTRNGPLINMDETTVQVLKEQGRESDSKSYMWVTVGNDSGNKIVLYNYSRTRSAQVAESLLEGFTGSLQTDGYAGYNRAAGKYNLWHVGCLAHIRRKFYEAAKATKSGGQANKALKYIKSLYRIEKELRQLELSPEEFVRQRRQQAIPVLKEFRKWLVIKEKTVLPSPSLGKAIKYALSEYVRLVRYLKYNLLTPDNNTAENAIRPFVVGRKNWLFNDTPKGAYASATIYSLVETAKANGVEPMAYLNHIFERLPLVSGKDDLEMLLPWNIREEELTIRK